MKHYHTTLLFLACNIAFSLAATPSLARTEGPDEFGYIATDDTPYTWEELSPDAGGSCLNVIDQDDWLDGNNDDGAYEIPIGFDFTYYGHAKTNLFISSNGFLAFDTASTEYTDFCIPSVEEPKRILCAFWDDVDPGNLDTNLFPNDGKVYWQTSGSAPNRRLTVEWYKCPHNHDTDARYTFEIVLYESGDFKTMYKDMLDGTGEFASYIYSSDAAWEVLSKQSWENLNISWEAIIGKPDIPSFLGYTFSDRATDPDSPTVGYITMFFRGAAAYIKNAAGTVSSFAEAIGVSAGAESGGGSRADWKVRRGRPQRAAGADYAQPAFGEPHCAEVPDSRLRRGRPDFHRRDWAD